MARPARSAQEPAPEPDRVAGHPHPRETAVLHGHAEAEQHFHDAWTSGRLHHAWLIRGPAGVGKATLAYRIARALIAQPPAGGFFGAPEIPATLAAPAGCPVRQRITAQSEARLFVLRRRPDDKGRLRTVITVDEVRALRRFLGLSATDGGWRVVIIDPADEMNRNAANALLKFLEEPPAETVFLLVSHAPAGLLPTIRSRCRTLDLRPLGPEDLANTLGDAGAEIPPGSEAALAGLAGGSAGQALRLVAGDGLVRYARLVRLFGDGHGIDRAGMTELAESCAGRANADNYRLVLDLTRTLIARLARAAATGETPSEAAPGEAALMATVAHDPRQAALWAEALADINATTRHAVAVNLDPAQTVLNTFLELDSTLGHVRAAAD